MGVTNILTFDAHDPRVQNAIPLIGFDNFQPPYQFMKALLRGVPDVKVDNEHLMHTIFNGILRIQGVASTETSLSLQELFQRQIDIHFVEESY